MKAIPRIQYRRSAFLNMKTMKPVYGIQCNYLKQGWANLAQNNAGLLFDNEADREAKLKELRKAALPAKGATESQ